MDKVLKQKIITKLLQEQGIAVPENILTTYEQLSAGLDSFDAANLTIFNFSNIIEDEKSWKTFREFLNLTPHSDLKAMDFASQVEMLKTFERANQQDILNKLPNAAYYDRPVVKAEEEDQHINNLISKGREKLKQVITETLPKEHGYNLDKQEDLNKLMTVLRTGKNLSSNSRKNALLVLQDLSKLNQLTPLLIPTEQSEKGPLPYYQLAETVGGVTEKISLISQANLDTQLSNLQEIQALSLGNYSEKRESFKLSTDAILKLPKRGQITEVQREAIALNNSRVLGLHTTQSIMVSFQQKPALFIPFDNVKLLRDYAQGNSYNSINPLSNAQYQHYSTINPVGEGLQGDIFVDDFGPSFGFFYLCSDTDAIGGYNQNKALYQDKSLYIFDQVVMSDDKLAIDSRLSMQPSQTLMKHSRHGQGRNRTLIEDSPLNSKFDSVMALKAKQSLILGATDEFIDTHNQRIKTLKTKLTQSTNSTQKRQINDELNQVIRLQEDAVLLHKVQKERITKIDAIFPKRSQTISNNDLKQTLILEKLMHNPVLYSQAGRPFKHPWTQRHNNPIKAINESKTPNFLILTFDKNINIDMVKFIIRHMNPLPRGLELKHNQLKISRHDLAHLSETMLHPENQLSMAKIDYLTLNDLNMISKAYNNQNSAQVLSLIENYRKDPKVTTINTVLTSLNTLITHANQSGEPEKANFARHVLKKFHFEIQQQLQKSPNLSQKDVQKLNDAFIAAIKLDRVTVFHQFLLAHFKLNKPIPDDFLQQFITAGTNVNHQEACNNSKQLQDTSQSFLNSQKQQEMKNEVQSYKKFENENEKQNGLDFTH